MRPAPILGGGKSIFHVITNQNIKSSLQDSYDDPIAKLVMSGDEKHSYVNLRVRDGIIFNTDRDGGEQLYVPASAVINNSQPQSEHPVEGDILRPICSLREELLRHFHNNGHTGTEKTYFAIKKLYYWPKLRISVAEFVRGCKKCQTNKSRTHKEYGKLRALQLPIRRWAFVNMDFVVSLPKTAKGHDAIMVVIDQYSKRAHFIPTHTTANASRTAQLFYEYIWKLHGLPVKIVSDRDSKFTSKFWKSLTTLLGSELAICQLLIIRKLMGWLNELI